MHHFLTQAKPSQLRFWIGAFLLGLDMGLLFVLFQNFYFLWFDSFVTSGQHGWILAIIGLMTFGSLHIIDGYSSKRDMLSLDYSSEHVLALISAGLISIFAFYMFAISPVKEVGRAILPLTLLAFTPISLVYRRWMTRWLSKNIHQRKFLILGSGPLAQSVYLDSKYSTRIRQRFEAIDILSERVGQSLNGVGSPVVEGNPLKKLESLNGNYDGIIFAMDRRGMDKELTEKLIESHFGHVPILSIEKFYEEYFRRVPASIVHPQTLLGPGFEFARHPVFENVKRMVDLTIASIVTVLTSPILLVLPFLIRMDSKGPAIFSQERTGKNNKPFKVYKFRTMCVQDETKVKAGQECTAKNDSRITPFGKFLRAAHLDELPQLWNVLAGDMSIIGPRPEQHKLTRVYESQFPCYRYRHLVKPGITGWSQVNINYGMNFEDAVKKFEFDLYYLKHYSFKLDAAILMKTAHQMVFGQGR